jgi:PAS domain S-box-containing protein
MKTLRIIIRQNSIYLTLGILVTLLVLSTWQSVQNRQLIAKSNHILQQTSNVRAQTDLILFGVLHGVDLGIRAYVIFAKDDLLTPYHTAIEIQDSVFYKLRTYLREQQYDTRELEEINKALTDYILFNGQIIENVKQGKLEEAREAIKADKGYELWKRYDTFKTALFRYQDVLEQQARQKYESSLARSSWIQIILLILSLPMFGFIAYKLGQESRRLAMLLEELDQSNRRYLFDENKKIDGKSTTSVIQHSIQIFKQASEFVKNLIVGNYETDWEGMHTDNLNLNQDTLSGYLIGLRDQMKALKVEEMTRIWSTEGLSQFSVLVRNHQTDVAALSKEVVRFLTRYLKTQQGGLFVYNEVDNSLELSASYAFDRHKILEKCIPVASGLIGQTFLEAQSIVLTEVPQHYTYITSGLGDATPNCIAIIPMKYNNKVEAILELASFDIFQPEQIAFLEKAGEFVASALLTVRIASKTNQLLEQAQQQAQLLKAQEEEMRENFKELKATQEEFNRRSGEFERFTQSINKYSIIIELGANGKILYINEKFMQATGYSSSDLIGKPYATYIPVDQIRSGSFEKLWEVLSKGNYVEQDIKRLKKNGDSFWLRAYYFPVVDATGQLSKIVCICSDITQKVFNLENEGVKF